MSYVRWSSMNAPHPYESDVYIYDDVSGGITCNGSCGSTNLPTVEDMVQHVQEAHITLGEAVPDFVIPRLRRGQNFN